jgi:Zn-dependent protease
MASNFVIAAVAGVAIRILDLGMAELTTGQDPVARLLYAIAMGNVFIGIFNILPFPGRDTWRLLVNNAPYEMSRKLEASANMVSIIMLLLIIVGVFSPVFSVITGLFHLLFIS